MKHIVIDAGHGGHDSGAVGNGHKEKDITLEVSLEVAKRLQDVGFKVSMTRTTDKYVGDAGKRGETMGKTKADYGLSIHCNSASAIASGAEIICPMRERYAFTESALRHEFEKLGHFRKIFSRDYHSGKFYDRPVSGTMFAKSYSNTDYYGVIREAWRYGVSCDILEMFFINNKTEVDTYLKQKQDYVEAIVQAMCTAFDVPYEAPVKPKPPVVSNDLWYQVIAGSPESRQAAEKVKDELIKLKYEGVWLKDVVVKGVTYTRVIVGSYKEKDNADSTASRLKAQGFTGVWINSFKAE